MWYTRPDGSTDDSLTDVSALALIGGYDCGAHIRACQLPSGRMRRHPDTASETFSRDHTAALCFFSAWSGDRTPLRHFFWYTLRNGFQHCKTGSIGQRFQNPNSIAAISLTLGGAYRVFGLLLSLACFPFVLLAAKRIRVGYRLILAVEWALLFWLAWPKWMRGILACVPRAAAEREPCNTVYRVVLFLMEGKKITSDILWELARYKRVQQTQGTDGLWLWSEPSGGRHGVGIEVDYCLVLAQKFGILEADPRGQEHER